MPRNTAPFHTDFQTLSQPYERYMSMNSTLCTYSIIPTFHLESELIVWNIDISTSDTMFEITETCWNCRLQEDKRLINDMGQMINTIRLIPTLNFLYW